MGYHCYQASYKMLLNIPLSRLSPYIDEIIGDQQCGFRHNRSTTDQTFCIHRIQEKTWEYNETVHQLFIDFNTSDQKCEVISKCKQRLWSTATPAAHSPGLPPSWAGLAVGIWCPNDSSPGAPTKGTVSVTSTAILHWRNKCCQHCRAPKHSTKLFMDEKCSF
jgi:hypothetical protein